MGALGTGNKMPQENKLNISAVGLVGTENKVKSRGNVSGLFVCGQKKYYGHFFHPADNFVTFVSLDIDPLPNFSTNFINLDEKK